MKTAEEFYRQITGCVINHGDIKTAMIEFAKLHAKAALQKANKNARIDVNGNKVIASGFRDRDGNQVSISIDKHSITNAYPESNIK
jgi:hypothetical protein